MMTSSAACQSTVMDQSLLLPAMIEGIAGIYFPISIYHYSLTGSPRVLECPGKSPVLEMSWNSKVSWNVLENYNCPGKVSWKMARSMNPKALKDVTTAQKLTCIDLKKTESRWYDCSTDELLSID